MLEDHWNRNTVDFLKPHLASALSKIRIATGFFTVQGYDLLRPSFIDKEVYLLVGYDEASAERLKSKLVDDIMAHLSRWEVRDRRAAVLDLVEKIRRGELRVVEREKTEFLDARIRTGDHAKIYIIDEDRILVGSSNLTFT